jgi:hypothetical protein
MVLTRQVDFDAVWICCGLAQSIIIREVKRLERLGRHLSCSNVEVNGSGVSRARTLQEMVDFNTKHTCKINIYIYIYIMKNFHKHKFFLLMKQDDKRGKTKNCDKKFPFTPFFSLHKKCAKISGR